MIKRHKKGTGVLSFLSIFRNVLVHIQAFIRGSGQYWKHLFCANLFRENAVRAPCVDSWNSAAGDLLL